MQMFQEPQMIKEVGWGVACFLTNWAFLYKSVDTQGCREDHTVFAQTFRCPFHGDTKLQAFHCSLLPWEGAYVPCLPLKLP